MEDREMFSSSKVRRTWQDFLEHMCRPSASYFIQSIKSFIVSSSNNPPDAEKDSDAVMFFPDLEADFQAHTLLDGCSEKELEIAGEGLERYVMTKLYSRVLATVPDDVNEQLSEKMALIQQFIELSVWRFSFVVASSNKLPNPERDSGAVQQFFQYMESAFRGHPLWAGCSEEELESAGEGLEKYVMIKLYDRLFASAPDDVKADEQLYEKMALVQQFIRPENLDIKSTCQNGSSWLLAQEELQKINMYKAPRKKLASILNCCKVITNLLHNAAMTANQDTPGADEFFPVLIYVILKANPPQLHSNLQYIQRYRSQSRMVSETAYYFTNILSAVAFISSIGAESLSVNKMEFDRNMDSARAVLYRATSKAENADAESVASSKSLEHTGLPQTSPYPSATCSVRQNNLLLKDASAISEENDPNDVFQEFPYVCYSGEDLSVGDIECLRNNYNKLVFKYACLANGLSVTPSPPVLSIQQPLAHQPVETIEEPESTKDGTRAIKRQPDQGPF